MERSVDKEPEVEVKKKRIAKEDRACHIVITCGHPTADGKMAVEMSYEGDPNLASYLLESAQGFIDHDDETLCN